MEIQDYFSKKKEFYNLLINYIDDESVNNENYQLITLYLDKHEIKDRNDIKEILYLLLHISNNHHRQPDFFKKIEKIISIFEHDIKKTLSNLELFNIFKSNFRILLILFEKKLISLDKEIQDNFTDKHFHFFYPEIKSSLDEDQQKEIESILSDKNSNIFDNFDENRKKGQNESYICSLISNDSVEEFISYVTKSNTDLSQNINPSIFETNDFLIDRKQTLIEYAAFYGSIQIFNYLRMSGVKLNPSLWLYSIHSNNPELIHLLEENKVEPEDKTYEKCLEESIKCHHNNIARYIQNNFMNDKKSDDNYSENAFAYGFHYYNYEFIPDDFATDFAFHYACQYDYFSLVKILFSTKDIDINQAVISS